MHFLPPPQKYRESFLSPRHNSNRNKFVVTRFSGSPDRLKPVITNSATEGCVSVELQGFIRQLHCRALKAGGAESVSDAELLRRFVAGRDEASFELLVWRHGILVLGTCRRVLGSTAEVDDAFQATFLALLRQAGRIRRSESLPGWLHRVARRIAIRARTAGANRQHHERQAAVPEVKPPADAEWSDLGPIVDQEIDRLPERFRLPFILCQLQGRSHEEAAQQLRLPKGTLLSRLARAKEKLRFRLSRRGVTPGVAALGVAGISSSSVSAHLIGATMKTAFSGTEAAIAPAVASLTEGVLNTMFWNKFKIAACLLLTAGAFASGGTAWACHRWHLIHRHDGVQTQVCACAEPPVLPAIEPAAPTKPAAELMKAEPPTASSEPPTAPVDEKVRHVLAEYSARRKTWESIVCRCSQIRKNKAANTTTEYQGEFRFLKPNLAALRMIQKNNPMQYSLIVQDGRDLYLYEPDKKTVSIWAVAKDEGLYVQWDHPWFGPYRLPVFGPFSNLLDADAEETLRQFEIKLTKQDANYIYLEIKPRKKQQWLEFSRAQLVLFAKDYIPVRWWEELPNGDEITWNVFDIDTKVKLNPSHFLPPPVPPGWKTQRVPQREVGESKDETGKKTLESKESRPPAKP